jgi:hypothetical protein
MTRRTILVVFLMITVTLGSFGQFVVVGGEEGGPVFTVTGELLTIATVGLQDEDQMAINTGSIDQNAPGIYYGERIDMNLPGKTGYYLSVNLAFLLAPVSYIEVYTKFLTQFRPGSPYLPMQLENTDPKDFTFTLDSAYSRINLFQGIAQAMDLNIPLDLWVKGGKFDAAPANFHRVTRFGVEGALNQLRPKNEFNMQVEAGYPLLEKTYVSLGATTSIKLSDDIAGLFDVDSKDELITKTHGSYVGEYYLPFHLHAKMKDLSLGMMDLSVEALYAYNSAMHVYSGNSFGGDIGATVSLMDTLKVVAGLGLAWYEKNVDTFAGTAVINDNPKFLSFYGQNGYFRPTDVTSTGFRETLRFGIGAGARYTSGDISAEANVGFGYTSIAHIYRETLEVPSLSFDLRAAYKMFFIGGGLFLGTLQDLSWDKQDGVIADDDDPHHQFNSAENLGFEIFGGLQFQNKTRFVIGYNVNKGIAMNFSMESLPEAQIKYLQKGTSAGDEGLFERGGVFIKLAVTL